MGKLNKLKHFFFRLLIYFIIILWPASKLHNIFQDVEGFKKAIFRNLSYYNFKIDPNSNENSELILIIFFCYTMAEFIFSLLGLFNLYIGHLFSMIFFFITNFIYFNPFLEENKLKLVNPKIESFYNIGIFFSLGVLAFSPIHDEKVEEKPLEKPINLEEDEEMKKSMPVKKNKKLKK